MIYIFSPVLAFLTGLAVGSFLNVCIYRIKKGESAFKGRSYCPQCKHALSWHDLIPLLSFILLKAKCRYCPPSGDVLKEHKQRISFQYPLVELATGFLFVGIFFSVFPWSGQVFPTLIPFSFPQMLGLLYLWVIASILVVIFVYDLKHYIIPDKVLFPAFGLVLFWRIFEFLHFDILNLFGIWDLGLGTSLPLVQAMLAALGASTFFFGIYILSRGRAMGFGDVKLAFFMGLFLGWPNILVAMSLAFSAGAIVGLVLIFFKRKTMRSEVPFAPFLVLGTFGALFWGEQLVDFSMRFLVV